MDAETKARLLSLAEVFDSYRIFPRFVICPFVGFYVWKISWLLCWWYIHEPPAGRGTQESAMVTGVLASMAGLVTLIVNTYAKTGRDWANSKLSA